MLARAGVELDALLRFQQEGAVLRSMSHPNIVAIRTALSRTTSSCIIMELLEGSHSQKYWQMARSDLDRAKTIALQMAEAPGIRPLPDRSSPRRKARQHHGLRR